MKSSARWITARHISEDDALDVAERAVSNRPPGAREFGPAETWAILWSRAGICIVAERCQADDEALRKEARRWIVRLTSGAATDADAWRLSLWRNQSPRHEAAYVEAIRLWHQLPRAAARHATIDEAQHQPRLIRRRRAILGGVGLAAAVSGLVVGADRLAVIPTLGELNAQYRTGTGDRRRLVLEDGSVVEMNTRTSLSVRYDGSERRVELAGGEALFTVMPRSARPFIVAAAGGETRAVGTVFDVRRDAEAVCVTCLEGRVRVQRFEEIELQAAQQVSYSSDGLGRSRSIDADLVTGWRQGVLVFRDEPLSRVVAELNRYRPGLVLLAGADKAGRRVSGVFHLDRLDEVVTQIARTAGLRPLSLPGQLVILR